MGGEGEHSRTKQLRQNTCQPAVAQQPARNRNQQPNRDKLPRLWYFSGKTAAQLQFCDGYSRAIVHDWWQRLHNLMPLRLVGIRTLTTLLYLEDLSVGQKWISPSRTITADDVTEFATLTGDNTPLHGTVSSASDRLPFGRPVVHGLLGLGILAGLSSEHPQVSTMALVELGNWRFLRPIYFGDTVFAETEILAIEPYGRKAGRVRWHRRLLGEDFQVFQEGEFETIVARQVPLSRDAVVAHPAAESSVSPMTNRLH